MKLSQLQEAKYYRGHWIFKKIQSIIDAEESDRLELDVSFEEALNLLDGKYGPHEVDDSLFSSPSIYWFVNDGRREDQDDVIITLWEDDDEIVWLDIDAL